MNIFSKAKEKTILVKNKILTTKTGSILGVAGTALISTFTSPAFAITEGKIQELFGMIIKIIAILVTVGGLVMGVLGGVHYAEANGDGDGPAKTKAGKQISGGLMMLVMALILFLNASKIAGMIETAI